jgi:tryptophan halogenase
MNIQPVKKVVILGGGSAGWLTAGVLAAEHKSNEAGGLAVTVIESPTVAPIGVGEGTWPTMRTTLARIGVTETEFFRNCDASFKQGIKFVGWLNGGKDDYYYHPLELPRGFNKIDLVSPWQKIRDRISFADAVCFQGHLCERNLAPKQLTTPEYGAVANYAYHFSSVKLGEFLTKHCTEKLGVRHILDDVIEIEAAESGDIHALKTKSNGSIAADLFIDCSGFGAMLLGKHFGIPFKSIKHVIYNDTALAIQVPYVSADSPIASHTIATAQSNGWIWDIGLPTRRGIGNVYSSAYTSEEAASEELREYIAASIGQEKAAQLSFRRIKYEPGFRAEFWHRNCVAVGLSAGFVEPLEATALIMIEAAATLISAELPATRDVMDIVAKRFNRRFTYYWDTTIDFLKLQYALTRRTDTEYWKDCAREETIPDRLRELLQLWRRQAPNKHDFPLAEEMLPAASWQYILYGMGFVTDDRATSRRYNDVATFEGYVKEVNEIAQRYIRNLPTNRDLINRIHKFGLQKI